MASDPKKSSRRVGGLIDMCYAASCSIFSVDLKLLFYLQNEDDVTNTQVARVATYSLCSQTEHVVAQPILIVLLQKVQIALYRHEYTAMKKLSTILTLPFIAGSQRNIILAILWLLLQWVLYGSPLV